MDTDETLWDRHRIEEAGLSIEFYRPWPLNSMIEKDYSIVYQLIDNTVGAVFVRYGKDQVVKTFIENLGDMITKVSVIHDEDLIYCGSQARHVTLLLHKQSLGMYIQEPDRGLIHTQSPETRNLISVIGFSNRGIPILVGYRLPEERLDAYRPFLERILNSVNEVL